LYGNVTTTVPVPESQSSGCCGNSNHVYLLQYKEEMNEFTVDAQLELPSTTKNNNNDTNQNDYDYNANNNSSSCGEIWCLSSCPVDPTLLVTNTGTNHHTTTTNDDSAAETILWRMPKEALREDDDHDYYHSTNDDDDDDDDDGGLSGGGRHRSSSLTSRNGNRGGNGGGGDVNMVLEQMARLSFPNDESHTNSSSSSRRCPSILRGRVSDMHWNPECIPENVNEGIYSPTAYDDSDYDDVDDEDRFNYRTTTSSSSPKSNNTQGLGLSGGGGGANFLTVEYGTSTVTTWDMSTSSAIPIDRISIPASPSSSSTTNRSHSATTTLYTTPKASWDPHNTNLIAVTTGRDVALLDVRCSTTTGGSGFVGGIQACHKLSVMDVDHNPNMPHLLTTCGQDGLVKFWDVRKGMGLGGGSGGSSGLIGSTSFPSSPVSVPSPLKDDHQHNTTNYSGDGSSGGCWMMDNPLRTIRGGHTHWSTVVKYNSFHDQLVLSGGTDGMVNLWRISSISSAPMMLDVGGGVDGGDGGGGSGSRLEGDGGGEEDDLSKFLTYRDQEDGGGGGDGYGADRDNRINDDRAPPLSNNNNNTTSDGDGGDKPDVRVTKMELSEAVYDLAWSAADPWIFVSLGFDGSVILNHVPSKEKYKILL